MLFFCFLLLKRLRTPRRIARHCCVWRWRWHCRPPGRRSRSPPWTGRSWRCRLWLGGLLLRLWFLSVKMKHRSALMKTPETRKVGVFSLILQTNKSSWTFFIFTSRTSDREMSLITIFWKIEEIEPSPPIKSHFALLAFNLAASWPLFWWPTPSDNLHS